MGGLLNSYKKEEETPIKHFGVRLKNIAFKHFRGLLALWVPLIAAIILLEKTKPGTYTAVVYIWMFWFLLIQPVNVPVVSLIPVFALPMTCVLKSKIICGNFFVSAVALLVIGGWILMLFNNSKLHRRLMMYLLCIRVDGIGVKRLIFQASITAYLLSMLCNRLFIADEMMKLFSTALINAQSSSSATSNYNLVRYILCNAIQTSSTLGSLAMVHSSFAILGSMAAIPEPLDFFTYSAFAIPTTLIMFGFNYAYHIILCMILRNKIRICDMSMLIPALKEAKDEIPKKISLHEILTAIFLPVILLLYFTRSSKLLAFMGTGWASLFTVKVHDVTISAAFAIMLHILPHEYKFFKYAKRLKTSELPPLKPASAVLYFKFIDKYTNYGYMLLIGAGVALNLACVTSGVTLDLGYELKSLKDMGFVVNCLVITLICGVLCNIMSCLGAVIMAMPMVLSLKFDPKASAVLVGFVCSFGFCAPFMYTPAYYCKTTAKIPLIRQIIFGSGSAVICCFITFIWVAFVSPHVLI